MLRSGISFKDVTPDSMSCAFGEEYFADGAQKSLPRFHARSSDCNPFNSTERFCDSKPTTRQNPTTASTSSVITQQSSVSFNKGSQMLRLRPRCNQ